VVLNQSLNRVWIWVSFQVNREYIADYLCENKDRPEMACGGKCHLMKQMAAAEQQDAEIPSLKSHFEVIFFIQELTNFSSIAFHLPLLRSQFIINYLEGVPNHFHPAIFHPPRCC
jgi:hypothetical protein